MKSTYYTSKFTYAKEYDCQSIRGIDVSRPWNLIDEVIKISSPAKTLLDIGCGTGLKLIHLAPHVKRIIGLEPNLEMLKAAYARFASHSIANYELISGEAQNLPFGDSSIDIVTSMMAPHDINEVYRVLVPGGTLVIETVGEMDKRNLKNFFKSNGEPRGQLSGREEGETISIYTKELSFSFEQVKIRNGFWETLYSKEGLLALLLQTPTVSDFSLESDSQALQTALASLPMRDGMYVLTQHRLLITAKKPGLKH